MSKLIEEKEKPGAEPVWPFTCGRCHELWGREERVCEHCGYWVKHKRPSPIIRLHKAR
jgi:rRNA maturation endonuclease Nob1